MHEDSVSGQQAVELKPCPFCGGMAQRTDVPTDDESDPNAGGSFIECRECAASTALHFDRKENLEDSWNSRAAPTAPSTVLSDAHAKAADEAWLKAEGGIMEAIHATFAAGYEAAVNERAAAPSTAAGEPPKHRVEYSTHQQQADACAALTTPPAQGVEEETETLENLIGAAIGARTAPSWQEQAAQQCEAWAKAHRSTDMELFCRIFADDFRALARSEKGEEK